MATRGIAARRVLVIGAQGVLGSALVRAVEGHVAALRAIVGPAVA